MHAQPWGNCAREAETEGSRLVVLGQAPSDLIGSRAQEGLTKHRCTPGFY